MQRLDLAVLETRWWPKSNSSVKPLFDTLADLICDNPGGYHYEMFNTGDSFRSCIRRVAEDRKLRHVYIGAHGSEKGIDGPDGPISRTVIGNTLNKVSAQKGASLVGLHFGSCEIGNEDTVSFILEPTIADRVKLAWVAGYCKSVNWVTSSAVDLFFWNKYYGAPKRLGNSHSARIGYVAKEIARFMPGAHRELGLEIFVRRRGRLVGLLKEALDR
jgi:hypothetical protein